jgi:hypothetical protein
MVNGQPAEQIYEYGVQNKTTGIAYPFSSYETAKEYAEATKQRLVMRAVLLGPWFDAK